MKQLTVPLFPDPNCSMPENDAQYVIPVNRTSRGFVVMCIRPQATVLKSSPAPRDNNFDCSLNRHEITVYYYTLHIFYYIKVIRQFQYSTENLMTRETTRWTTQTYNVEGDNRLYLDLQQVVAAV